MAFRDNSKRSTDRPLWLHLETRSGDVLAIARMHPTWRTLLLRWDRDDLEQELLLRVLERQEKHRPYDGTRAGLPKYLATLTGSILLNLLEATRTTKATSEQVGAVLVEDGERVEVDAALVAVGVVLPPLSRAGKRHVEALEAEFEPMRSCGKQQHQPRPRRKPGTAKRIGADDGS